MRQEDQTSPVSFKANVARLPAKGLPVVVEADAKQREELAAIHQLVSVESYRAELLVTPWKRNGVKVSGVVKAEVSVRNAVVSGVVVGNISASESVEITREGRMVGDIAAPRGTTMTRRRFWP